MPRAPTIPRAAGDPTDLARRVVSDLGRLAVLYAVLAGAALGTWVVAQFVGWPETIILLRILALGLMVGTGVWLVCWGIALSRPCRACGAETGAIHALHCPGDRTR